MSISKRTDLDVDAPDKVSNILRYVAEEYRNSAIELPGIWQDKNAGKVWAKIATVLERAANSIDTIVNRED